MDIDWVSLPTPLDAMYSTDDAPSPLTSTVAWLHLAAATIFFLSTFAGLGGDGALAIAGLFWLAYLPSYLGLLVFRIGWNEGRPLAFHSQVAMSTPLFVVLLVLLSMA